MVLNLRSLHMWTTAACIARIFWCRGRSPRNQLYSISALFVEMIFELLILMLRFNSWIGLKLLFHLRRIKRHQSHWAISIALYSWHDRPSDTAHLIYPTVCGECSCIFKLIIVGCVLFWNVQFQSWLADYLLKRFLYWQDHLSLFIDTILRNYPVC